MHLQKEEVAVIVLLLCATLAMCTLAFLVSKDPLAPYTEKSRPGDIVRLEGQLLGKEKTYRGGHLILTVKAEVGLIKVFVPSTGECYDDADSIKPGNYLLVCGKVQEYQGEREIVATSVTAM